MTTAAPGVPNCGAAIRAINDAIGERIRGVVISREATDIGELLFTHPLHETLVRVTVEAAAEPFSQQLTTLRVMLLDLDASADPVDAIERSLSANLQLMGCATALAEMDQYPRAIVLTRRVPTAALPAADVPGAIDDMVWEWVQLTRPASDT